MGRPQIAGRKKGRFLARFCLPCVYFTRLHVGASVENACANRIRGALSSNLRLVVRGTGERHTVT